MEYSNVLISAHTEDKIREIFEKYFTKGKVSLGSLCRKSFSFMTTLSMMYPEQECIFEILSNEDQYKYECIIKIKDKTLFTILYEIGEMKDYKNVSLLIKSVFIKQKYLKLLFGEDNRLIIRLKHRAYQTTVMKTSLEDNPIFAYTCYTKKMTLGNRFKEKMIQYIFGDNSYVHEIDVEKK